MLKIRSEIPLTAACPTRYQGIACDGCHFYLTKRNESEIVRLDHHFQELDCIGVCRCYASLCYDPDACCFWASSDQYPSMLFQLDKNFRETDRVLICNPQTHAGVGRITGISFDFYRKCLVISCAAGLIWLTIKACSTICDFRLKVHPWVTTVVNAGECTLYCSIFDGRQVIRVDADCAKKKEFCVPKGILIEAAVPGPCAKQPGGCCLYFLAYKHGCYPCLLECSPEDCCLCEGCCCHCPCPPTPPHPPQHSCEDLLESIALMEAALSHILNAEGEKLQKVIASTDDPRVLLEVNEAVSKTLINATFLEQILYHKLSLAESICEPCKPKHDHDPDDWHYPKPTSDEQPD